jgi:DNA polymerase III epsilon subunit-like protein
MFVTRTMSGGMVEPTSDGRTRPKMTDWTSLSYVVVDVEGNGQQPPELVEVATVPIIEGVIGKPSSWLVKPALPIKHFATRIHGLTNADVADAPLFADIEDDVRSSLTADVLVAHNAHVDVDVLQRHLGEWKCPEVMDTLKLAKRLRPNRMSYKLGALVEAFDLAEGLPEDLTPHRATYDVLVTARLFVRLATRDDDSPLLLEELRGQQPEGGEDEATALF